jgi:hypothetical protein
MQFFDVASAWSANAVWLANKEVSDNEAVRRNFFIVSKIK